MKTKYQKRRIRALKVIFEALEERDMTSHGLALLCQSKQIRSSRYFVGMILTPFVERGEVLRLKNKDEHSYYSLPKE